MNYNALTADEFSEHRPWNFEVVRDVDALNRRIAREAVDAIGEAGRQGRSILIITPVGPLEYSYWAEICNEEGVSCKPLVTIGMDEYLNDDDHSIPTNHPLSFRNYVHSSLVENLNPELRPDPENVRFPDPHHPEETTEFVESFGGADLCYGAFGITGHFAFNDPPRGDEPENTGPDTRTRKVTILPESKAQMCMGGTHGNWDILPDRAVTLGMYELLMSKKIHLTFMRSWHAGVLRRALFGPVTDQCPGSFIQQHPDVRITLTELAAAPPLIDVTQDTGEESE